MVQIMLLLLFFNEKVDGIPFTHPSFIVFLLSWVFDLSWDTDAAKKSVGGYYCAMCDDDAGGNMKKTASKPTNRHKWMHLCAYNTNMKKCYLYLRHERWEEDSYVHIMCIYSKIHLYDYFFHNTHFIFHNDKEENSSAYKSSSPSVLFISSFWSTGQKNRHLPLVDIYFNSRNWWWCFG